MAVEGAQGGVPGLPAAVFSGLWQCRDGDWVYDTTFDASKAKLDGDIIKCEVTYTVVSSPSPSLIGRSGTEYIEGTFNSSTGIFVGKGTKVSDEEILGVSDKYEFRFDGNHCRGMFGDEEVDLWARVDEAKEIIIQREISRIKTCTGFVRFLFEDLMQGILQVLFLIEQNKTASSSTLMFTIVSITSSVLMSLAGPVLESFKQRQLNAELQKTSVEEETLIIPSSAADVQDAEQGTQTKAVREQGELSERSSTAMLIPKKSDINVNAHGDIRIPDVSILSVLGSHGHAYRFLVMSAILFWASMVGVVVLGQTRMTCSSDIPANGSLLFCISTCFMLSIEMWIAMHTAKGYRFLTGFPEQFFFNAALTFLAKFDIYTNIIFVLKASECGSAIFMPSLIVFFVGVICFQAIPAIGLLLANRDLMWAMKLNDFHLLMQLVFAQTSAARS